jgi:hypothetical protein
MEAMYKPDGTIKSNPNITIFDNVTVFKKQTRSYPNGAVLNFMKYKLSEQRSNGKTWAYFWKRGELLWMDDEWHEDRVNIYYWKTPEDDKTVEEINEILKKHVKFFRAFYKQAKEIVLKEWDEIEERFKKACNEVKSGNRSNELKKELRWLLIFYHVYWLEYDKDNSMMHNGVKRMQNVMELQRYFD